MPIKTVILPVGWVTVWALIALFWGLRTLNQPLWLDELHSSWVISDGWQDLSQRASLGNQSPLYFWILKFWVWTVGAEPAWLIRLPSLLAWCSLVATFAVIIWQQVGRVEHQRRMGLAIGLGLLGCLLIDPIQYFFALEARTYGLLQLLNLWAWLAVVALVVSGCFPVVSASRRYRSCLWLSWMVVAIGMMRLHLTAGLSVATQCAVLLLVLYRRQDRWLGSCSLILVALAASWMLLENQPLWARRQQWQAFAGDASLGQLFSVLRWDKLLLPVFCCWLVGRMLSKITTARLAASQAPEPLQRANPNQLRLALWVVAACVPYGVAWLLTLLEIAPLFHYRFVIVGALPVYVVAGCWLMLMSAPNSLKLLTILIMLIWNSYDSGLNAGQWRYWGFQRWEAWRQATTLVSQKLQPETQQVWCFADLIESQGLQLPIDQTLDDYLSFPLRGCYRVRPPGSQAGIDPHGLIADRRQWEAQLVGQRQRLTDAQWIVYRGGAAALERDLRQAGLANWKRLQPLEEFGKVCVICIQQTD
jgi:mannosyltransferase